MYEMPKSEMCLPVPSVCVIGRHETGSRLAPFDHMTGVLEQLLYSASQNRSKTNRPTSDEHRSNSVMFHRFLRPMQPSSRRAYSLFSKPPGGRFFNSSKPPKVVPAASAKSPSRVEASTPNNNSNSNDPQQASSSSPS